MELTIIIEAFVARLLPLFHEVTLTAIRQFHPEQYPVPAALAGVGALAASALLYAIGIWLRRMPAKVSTPEQQARIQRMQAGAASWLPYLLIFAPTPIGGMLIMAAGFFAVRPVIAALMLVMAEIAWRLSPSL